MSTLSRAQRWMRHEGTSVQQYACNYNESCHDKQRCVTMNSSVCKRSLDFLDLCSTVLQDKNKTRDSRCDIIKTRSDVSHFRGQLVVFHDDRRTWERAAVSIDTEKDWFALDNRCRSSTDSSDGCQIVAVPITIDIEINSRCPKLGRKRRPPTTVHVRHKATRNSVHHTQRHQFVKNENLPDKAAGRIIEFSNDFRTIARR